MTHSAEPHALRTTTTPWRAAWLLLHALILYCTQLPFDYAGRSSSLLAMLRELPWVSPNVNLGDLALDVLQNGILFVPLGFAGAKALPRRLRWLPVPAGLIVSIVTELLQTTAPTRSASVLDIIANTGGTSAGILLSRVRAGLPQMNVLVDRARRLGLSVPVLVLAAIVVVEALWPFDICLQSHFLGSRIDFIARYPLAMFARVRNEGAAFCHVLLLTMVISRALHSCGSAHPRLKALVAGWSVAIVAESSQLPVGSQLISLQEGLSGMAGALIGMGVGGRRLRASHLYLLLLSAGAMLILSPCDDPTHRALWLRWVPVLPNSEQAIFAFILRGGESLFLVVPFAFVARWFGLDMNLRPSVLALGVVTPAVWLVGLRYFLWGGAVQWEHAIGWSLGLLFGQSLAGWVAGATCGRTAYEA